MTFTENEYYEVLPNQKSFYLSRNIKTNSLYNQGVVFFFNMELSTDALRDIYNVILRTNDSLRIRFTDDSKFCICPYSQEDMEVPYFSNKEELFRYAQTEVNIGLDITEKCFKAIPFIMPGNTGFILIAHHIICDGWSEDLIIRRFIDAAHNKTSEIVYSYSKHIDDELKYTGSKKYSKDVSFVENKISEFGDAKLLNCVTDNDYTSDCISSNINAEILKPLFSYCTDNELYPSSVLTALTSLCISRIYGHEKICIGTPVSNRFNEYDTNTFGLFMHILPLYISFDNISVPEYLNRVNDEYLTLLRHNMLNDVFCKNDTVTSLFDVAINCRPQSDDFDRTPLFSDSLSLPIEIHFVFRKNKSIDFILRYRKSLIEKKTANALSESVKVLISGFSNQYGRSIKTVDIVTAEDKEKLIFGYNNTFTETNYSKKLWSYFRDKVNLNPGKNAIITNDRILSYLQLDEMISSYASKLSGLGISPGDRVAVSIRRVPDLPALQMALIYLGAIFVPINRDYPADRISSILSDCQAGLYIYDNDFSGITDTRCISLNVFLSSDSRKISEPESGESCYVIYTSGSTGKPKGCLLSEKSIVNFCINNNTLTAIKEIPDPVFACVNNSAFDYFIAETILPLVNGYTVVLLNETECGNKDVFLKAVRSYGINVLMTTPTRLNIFYNGENENSSLAELRCICSSGEKLPQSLLNTIKFVSPDAVLFNPLGPSECTVWVAGGEMKDEVSIGYPISNVQLYVLDTYLQPVPFDVIGELCVAGVAVGNGYINDSKANARSFIDNPFGEGKLYRTGDLVYRRKDGSLIYIGRNDSQIKIHGLRIELSEIENAATGINGITGAVAAVRNINNRDTVVLYYSGTKKDEKEFKKELLKTLPEYMIPGRILFTEKFCLTPNGKTDISKLPEVYADNSISGFAEPVNQQEKDICSLFSKILDIPETGRNSSFFDLGGDSISSLKLISEDIFEGISYSDLILHPTPAELSKLIDERKNCPETKTTHLRLLYKAEDADSVLVLFPYAGGNSTAFIDLIEKLRGKNFDIYFCPFFPSEDFQAECAAEIQAVSKDNKIIFCSHCAGSAVALSILSYMQENSMRMPEFFLASASIPRHSSNGHNPRRLMPDTMIINVLNKAGLGVDKGYIDVRRFLEDTDIYFSLMSRKFTQVDCKTYVLVSKNDIFTKNWSSAEKEWSKFLLKKPIVDIQEFSTHYFQKTEAEYFANILINHDTLN